MTSAEERFHALFSANYGDVFAYAVRRCSSRQDAEDVTADTFAVAWRRIEEIPEGERARAWLFGAAHLVRLSQERARRRQRSLADRLDDLLRTFGDRGDQAEVPERERIRGALEALSPIDREVLELHVWDELTAEEIAVVLDISTAAVWKRLQRARGRLSSVLELRSAEDPSTFVAVDDTVIRETP